MNKDDVFDEIYLRIDQIYLQIKQIEKLMTLYKAGVPIFQAQTLNDPIEKDGAMKKLKLSCTFGDDLTMPYDDVFKLLSNFFSKPTACTRFLKKRDLLVKKGRDGKYVRGLALKEDSQL